MAGSTSITRRENPKTKAARMVANFRLYYVTAGGMTRLNREFIKATDSVLQALDDIPGGPALKKHIQRLKSRETEMDGVYVELLPYNGLMHEDSTNESLEGTNLQLDSEEEEISNAERALAEAELAEKSAPPTAENVVTDEEMNELAPDVASIGDWNIGGQPEEEAADAESGEEENSPAATLEAENPPPEEEGENETLHPTENIETLLQISPDESVLSAEIETPNPPDLTPAAAPSPATPSPAAPEKIEEISTVPAAMAPYFLQPVSSENPAPETNLAETILENSATTAPDFLSAPITETVSSATPETIIENPVAAAPDFLSAPITETATPSALAQEAVIETPLAAAPDFLSSPIIETAVEPAPSAEPQPTAAAPLAASPPPATPNLPALDSEIAGLLLAFTPDYQSLEAFKQQAVKIIGENWLSTLAGQIEQSGNAGLAEQWKVFSEFERAIDMWGRAQAALAAGKTGGAGEVEQFEKYLPLFGEDGISLLNQVKNLGGGM